jgi:hypothetical protein
MGTARNADMKSGSLEREWKEGTRTRLRASKNRGWYARSDPEERGVTWKTD